MPSDQLTPTTAAMMDPGNQVRPVQLSLRYASDGQVLSQPVARLTEIICFSKKELLTLPIENECRLKI